MERTLIITKATVKKLSAFLLIAFIAVGAFATLGDGKAKSAKSSKSLLSSKSIFQNAFNLRSGYNYRGNEIFNLDTKQEFISINTVVTFQKGNITYTAPLKKNIILGGKVKIDIGNRQFQKN